jgi:WD40 repeat protein
MTTILFAMRYVVDSAATRPESVRHDLDTVENQHGSTLPMTSPSSLRLELIGSEQGWLSDCREVVVGGPRAASLLSRISDDSGNEAFALKAGRVRVDGDPLLVEQVGIEWTTACVIRDFALDLAGISEAAGQSVQPLLHYAAAAHLTSATSDDQLALDTRLVGDDAPSPLRKVFEILATAEGEGRDFAMLLALELSGRRPRKICDADVRVLFAGDATESSAEDDEIQGAGATGTLTITLLDSGPPGLHPDPAVMSFFTSDDTRFARSVFHAYAASPYARTSACLVWALRLNVDAATPTNHYSGGSLGGAFALALHQVSIDSRIHRALGKLRLDVHPKTFNRSATVTAAVTDSIGTLGPVGGLDKKLQAARRANNIRVVVVETSEYDHARRIAPEKIEVRNASTTTDAIKVTRARKNPQFRNFVVALTVLAVLVGTAIGLNVLSSSRSERLRVAAQLAQRSIELSSNNRRLSALAALASYRLDPSDQSLEAMARVVSENESVLGAHQIAQSAVVDMAVAGDTLLSLDAQQNINAWSLPDLNRMGQVAVDGEVKALSGGGENVFGLVADNKLNIYQGGLQQNPVLIKTLDSNTTGNRVYGPYFTTAQPPRNVLVFDENLQGVEWRAGSPEPLQFSLLTSRVLRRPANRLLRLVAAAPIATPDAETSNDKWNVIQSIVIATNARQLVALSVQQSSMPKAGQRVVLKHLATVDDAITAVLPLDTNHVLVGTEKGAQLWNISQQRIEQSSYAGISSPIRTMMSSDYQTVAAVTDEAIRFMRMTDGVQRAVTDLAFGDRTLTAVAAVDLNNSGYLAAGDSRGRIVLLDPKNSRFGPPSYAASNVTAFMPNNYLLIANHRTTPNNVDYIKAEAVPPKLPDPRLSDPQIDPFNVTYNLPTDSRFGGDDIYPYVNNAAATSRYVVASGQTSALIGTIWVWNRNGRNQRSVEFSSSQTDERERGEDIVTDITFIPDTQHFVAYNAAKGEVAMWDAETLKHLGSVSVDPQMTDRRKAESTFVMSADGSTGVVRTPTDDRARVKLTVLDLRQFKVLKVRYEDDHYGISLSRDGAVAAIGLPTNQVRILELLTGRMLHTFAIDDAANSVAFSPDGKKLAIGTFYGGRIQIFDTETYRALGPPWREQNAAATLLDLTWSSNSKWVATNAAIRNDDRNVPGGTRVLNAEALAWPKLLCDIAGEDLTTEEWLNWTRGTGVAKPDLCS